MSSAASPGRLLGSGRDADVYALDEGRVLRRYRDQTDVEAEARLMRYLHAAGYPVPEVYDATGSDLVMERLDGRDMLADVSRRPWLARRHARTLASLHDRLHQIEAPPGTPSLISAAGWPEVAGPDGTPLGAGAALLHLDLHPSNVMLTSRGPVVIDWTGARSGPPGADVAIAYLIMAVSETDLVAAHMRPVIEAMRSAFYRRFAAAARHSPWPYIAAAARLRIANPNTRPAEAARLLHLAERAAAS